MRRTHLQTFGAGPDVLHLERFSAVGRTHYALHGYSQMTVGFSWPAEETDRVIELLSRAVRTRARGHLYSDELRPGMSMRTGWMAVRLSDRVGSPVKIAMQGFGPFGDLPDGVRLQGRTVLTIRQWRPIRTAIEQLARGAEIVETACARGTLAEALAAPRIAQLA